MDRRGVHLENSEQEIKKSQESLRGQENSEQSPKVLTTDRIQAGSNDKSRKTVQPSENAHGLLSHCWWGNQPSYTISKWVQKASLRPDLRTTAHPLWNCIPSAVEESTQLFALDRYSLKSHFLKISEGSCGEQNNVPPQDNLDHEYVTLYGKGAFLVWLREINLNSPNRPDLIT